MVKPRLFPSRPELKPKQAQPSSSSAGAPRVGTRALTRTTTNFGANLLSSLRRSLLRGRKPAVPITAASPPAAVSRAPVSTPAVKPSSPAILRPKAPKPPPGADGEDSDESEDDEGDEGEEGRPGEISAKKPRKKAKRSSRSFNRWVPKLLNPVEKHRDRVHRKKKHAVSSYTGPPALFTEARTLHTVLLARIFAFLDPLEPARTTAYVNKTTAAAVRAYYDLYCPPPRPRRYLVHRTLEDPRSVFPAKLMALLPMNDRVRASASCRSFYAASNALPLEFNGSKAAQQFLKCSGFPRTRYIQKRYAKTPALAFSDMKAEAAVGIIQLLEGAGDDDEEEENEDDSDCFAAVRDISLTRVSDFAAAKGKHFERLLQTLFMGHVSSRLHTLELTGKEAIQDVCGLNLLSLTASA
ncbi:hypothetical protein BBJ28_00022257 [Nothophytophthora sp. Chile5]|nr:hypothetical protein BBJ28_00022257 [Nothophytophthora sp. Chile5]